MARFSGLGLLFRLVVEGSSVCLCALSLGAGWSGTLLSAQDKPTFTLHAYTDLIEIPVLVLGADRGTAAPVAANQFSVRLDGGPKFQATHVRREGDDPISLAILLDVSGPGTELVGKINDAIAKLAPLSLRPQDHVSIYALDCVVYRSLNDAPAESDTLKRGIDAVLQPWKSRDMKKLRPKCQHGTHLWDALGYITAEMYRLPGRRVILAVTGGNDAGSTRTWNTLRFLAQSTGVAIFGLTYVPEEPGTLHFRDVSFEDAFNSVCELSGGIVLTASRRTVGEEVKRFVTMLRERYIVEFPRPLKGKAGAHNLIVEIDKSDDIILASGISVPVENPAILADPTTVPSDPSHAPEFGKRRILNPQ
jgi:hypothetical protein